MISNYHLILKRLSYSPIYSFKRFYTIPPNFTLSTEPNKTKDGKGYDLNIHDIKDTLDNDPSLKYFFDKDTLKELENLENPDLNNSDVNDPYDFSNISMSPYSDPTPIINDNLNKNPYIPINEPQTMTTEDFIKMMKSDPSNSLSIENDSNIPSTDDYLENAFQNYQNTNSSVDKMPKSTVDGLTKIKTFLHKDDTPMFDKLPNLMNIKDIINSELPLILVSKLKDPRLNLSIEKFIYDNYPNPKDPLNKFARRLFLYKNSNCIVLGKNQNIFREINLRLASTYSIPILRRFSGGGTVVHDLGNYNFSFICSKNDFSRTTFTTELIKTWNNYYNLNEPHGSFELDINEKGDMINKNDKMKISGSAFQISKGKSLHHGTMLLHSDLSTLGKLLKLDKKRLDSIKDKATNSIPSPIKNCNIDEDLFINICVDSFTKKFGVPTNLENFVKKSKFNNLDLIKHDSFECQIFKIDDLTELPTEVTETYNQLKDWDWIFGKTPRFQMEFTIDNDNISLKFDINQGRIISIEVDNTDDNDTRLDDLFDALSNKENIVKFSGKSVGKYIKDDSLRRELAWRIDQAMDFDRVGIVNYN